MKSTDQTQSWQPDDYQKNAGFVPVYGAPILKMLNVQKGERVLDLGCGDGVLTTDIKNLGADVVGIDGSEEMVEAAKARGLNAFHGDGQALTFDNEFDAVFTNAALHWMRDADAVIAGVSKSLKPGGRFVGEFGGHGNVAAISTAIYAALDAHGIDGVARKPWYFPTPEAYQKKLEAGGFEVTNIGLIPRPTPLPTGIEGWLATFAEVFFKNLSHEEKKQIIARISKLLKPSLCDEQGNWSADYVRLRFFSVKDI